MRDTIPCPQCGSSARITERFWLAALPVRSSM